MIKNTVKKIVQMTISAKSGQGAESKRQEPAEGAIISITFSKAKVILEPIRISFVYIINGKRNDE